MRNSESFLKWRFVVFLLAGAGLGTAIGLIFNALAVCVGVGAGIGLILSKLTEDWLPIS